MFQPIRWSLTVLVGSLLLLAACGPAGEATPTPVSSIPGLPLPTAGPEEIIAVIMTPTPAAEGEEAEATAGPGGGVPGAEEAALTEEGDQATTEPNREAEEAALAEGGEAEATSEPAALSEEELINYGQELYRVNCAPCHQANGEGMLNSFPALNANPLVTTENPTPAIEIVLHGRGVMPGFGKALSAQQIAAILSYVRSAWNNEASPVSAGHVRQVQETASAQ